MKDKFDKSVSKALQLAARLHTARRGEKLSSLGLFPGQDVALQSLHYQGTMSMSELATALQVKPPTVSKMISRMSAQKFVERAGSDGDARQVYVSLTEKGSEAAKSLAAQWSETEEEMLARLDGKERKQLRKLLRKVAKTLSKTIDALPDDPDDEQDEA
jgi:MarR family transcriptional regulator, transcriptional regulator for hemolysin